MTKIESRPVKGKQWEYRFFVDFDGKSGGRSSEECIAWIERRSNEFENSWKLLDIRIDRKTEYRAGGAESSRGIYWKRGYLECVQTN